MYLLVQKCTRHASCSFTIQSIMELVKSKLVGGVRRSRYLTLADEKKWKQMEGSELLSQTATQTFQLNRTTYSKKSKAKRTKYPKRRYSP